MPKKPHKIRYEIFLTQLREARARAGLTQTEAAVALSQTQSFISKVEIGDRRLDVVDLIDFLQVYAVSPSEFVNELCNQLDPPKKGEASQPRRVRKGHP